MAEKRMFAKTIVDSDAFLDMPMSSQALYFHLNMRADDDGFVNNPKKIQRMLGASDDDLKLLIAKKFVIAFESGIIVIKHWRINNYLRKDRYTETHYQTEKAMLTLDENESYRLEACNSGIPCGIPMVATDKNRLDKNRLDKNRLDKNSIESSGRFTPPSIEEVKAYCIERNNCVDAETFIDFYESKGWLIGKNKMKDWKSAVRTWEKRDSGKEQKPINWFEVE